MRQRGRSGSTMLEAAMYVPLLLLLLLGMIEMGRVAYTYHTLHKTLFTLARYVGTQQGVDFCAEDDPTLTAALNYALTGALDDSAEPYLTGLTADMIQVRIERVDDQGERAECECSVEGCSLADGGLSPDYIVVSIPDGYPIRLNIPSLLLDPIPLKPVVRVPFGGT